MPDLGCRKVVQNLSLSRNKPDSQIAARNIEAINSSETSVLRYGTPQCNISEDSNYDKQAT